MPALENSSSIDRSAPRIGSRSTMAAWLLGTALLAAGAVAVFRTTNAAGSVALIAAGAAFILTAVWRHLPSTIKAGGFELAWTAYDAGRQQVVKDINETVEKGEDIKVELARLENETRQAEFERRLQLLKILTDRGLMDYKEIEINSLIDSVIKAPPELPRGESRG